MYTKPFAVGKLSVIILSVPLNFWANFHCSLAMWIFRKVCPEQYWHDESWFGVQWALVFVFVFWFQSTWMQRNENIHIHILNKRKLLYFITYTKSVCVKHKKYNH